jgi:probable HAF family extracellular repeat protein
MTRFRTSRLIPLAVLALAAGLPAAAPLAAPAAALTTAATTTYAITDLGSLGYGVSDGYGVNANGQVTGGSYLTTTVLVGGCCSGCYTSKPKPCVAHLEHAFLYGNGTMSDLGTLGGNYSVGSAINLSEEVAGWANTKAGGHDAFLRNGKTMVDLGAMAPLAGWESSASGINDSGQVVGSWGFNPGSHAWLYSNGKMTDLPEPGFATAAGATGCGADAINSNGQIIGGCDDANSYGHAVLWQNGTATDLGTLGGPQASASAINNLGQVVGWAATGTGAANGFLYGNGKMTDLGANFFPAAINDSGVIVGGNQIYAGGTLQNLDNLIPAGSPYQIQYATAINDNGQIVANAYDAATYQGHALLLTPA